MMRCWTCEAHINVERDGVWFWVSPDELRQSLDDREATHYRNSDTVGAVFCSADCARDWGSFEGFSDSMMSNAEIEGNRIAESQRDRHLSRAERLAELYERIGIEPENGRLIVDEEGNLKRPKKSRAPRARETDSE